MSEPGYWIYETSGVLRPVIRAYLNDDPMTGEQIAAMRAYLRQWIGADVWDKNPYARDCDREWLAELRAEIDGLTSREAIKAWLEKASVGGIDPL